ncbi:hypothetical protein RJT34_18684 [Clitoria ternatea]|uniref:Uncharacterized protein n=1 Tax=Clitoria ternatea TaxID=43366 RepID=A0AAN9PG40_CLITE
MLLTTSSFCYSKELMTGLCYRFLRKDLFVKCNPVTSDPLLFVAVKDCSKSEEELLHEKVVSKKGKKSREREIAESGKEESDDELNDWH